MYSIKRTTSAHRDLISAGEYFPSIYLYLQLLSVVMHSRLGKANACRHLAISFKLGKKNVSHLREWNRQAKRNGQGKMK